MAINFGGNHTLLIFLLHFFILHVVYTTQEVCTQHTFSVVHAGQDVRTNAGRHATQY